MARRSRKTETDPAQSKKTLARQVLEREYGRRVAGNPFYSKRAFARDLKLSSAFVSHLMGGRRRATPKVVQVLSSRLGLDPNEETLLMLEAARINEVSSRLFPEPTAIPLPVFSQIGEWWYVAILEFLDTDQNPHGPGEIAQKLGLSVENAEYALRKLRELGLVISDPRRPGEFKKSKSSQLIFSEAPAAALRKYHIQLLQKGQEALGTVPTDERLISSLTLAFDIKDLPEVTRRWRLFRASIEAFASRSKKKNQVYCAIFELFPLSQ